MDDQITLHPDAALFGGTVPAIASKSFAHRLLFLASLGKEPCRVVCPTTSKDIEATVSCMKALGAGLEKDKDTWLVTPAASLPPSVTMHAGESGSTLRFLLPLLGVLGCETDIFTGGRLAKRPLSPLKEEMAAHGVAVSVTDLSDDPAITGCIHTSGRMSGGTYTITGNISSQYITGLLMALPLAKESSTLRITGKLESRPYVDITLSCLKDFGIRVGEMTEEASGDTVFQIPGGQIPQLQSSDTALQEMLPPTCQVEGDWSNAAFFLAAGALSEKGVTVTGLNPASCQGDKRILEILEQFGAAVQKSSSDPTHFFIKKAPLRGITIDAADIPDLAPILSAVAAAAEGTTCFRHIERLRIKESDRVATIIDCLTSLGASAREEDGCLLVEGRGTISGGRADSHNDHRIAMTAAVLSLIAKGPVTITDAAAVEKSYPTFYNEFRRLM